MLVSEMKFFIVFGDLYSLGNRKKKEETETYSIEFTIRVTSVNVIIIEICDMNK